MKKIKTGLIGLSRRSEIVTSYLPENAELTAVADNDPEVLRQFTGEAVTYSDYKQLLADKCIDAVFIMTRDYQHEEIAIAALEAGKAVFLEKPMAITIDGCDRILAAAERTQSKFFVGHNMRYMPMVLKMKEIIDSGIIGTVQAVWCRHFIGYGSCYFRNWCSEQANTTGLLLQKGAHDIDVIHWLAGAYTKRVIGMGKLSVYDKCSRRDLEEAPDREKAFESSCWPPLANDDLSNKIDIEDHNMIMLQLENGIQASYTQCFYTPDSERNYTLIGTHGRVENIGDMDDCRIDVWTQRGSRQEPDISYKIKSPEGSHGGADPQMLKAFIDYVQSDMAPNISPVAARNAVAVGIMGHESMRNGNIPKEIPGI